MTEFTEYLSNKLLNHTFRNVVWTPPATVYISLYITPCTTSGRGIEVSGAGYARLGAFLGAPSAGRILNTFEYQFNASGDWGNVVCLGIDDALTFGNLLAFDNGFGDYQMRTGDKIVIPAGSLSIEF